MNSFIIGFYLLKRILGNRKGAVAFLLLPAMITSGIVYFNLSDTNSKSYRIAYVNLDEGRLGQELVQALERLPTIEMKNVQTEAWLQANVMRQKTRAAFVIPRDFSYTLPSGQDTKVKFIQLNRNAVNFSVQFAVEQMITEWVHSINQLKIKSDYKSIQDDFINSFKDQMITTDLGGEVLYINPKPKLRDVDGAMLLFIMSIACSSIGHMIEERKSGTLHRLFATPLHPAEILVGNFIGSCLAGIIQIVLVLAVTKWGLGFNYGIPFMTHLFILALFLVSSVGLASATVGWFKDFQYLYPVQLLIILPTCMVGGCFWAVSEMPVWMQKIANFVPQSWTIDALQRLKDGVNLGELGYHIGILILFSVIFLSFSTWIIQPYGRDHQR